MTTLTPRPAPDYRASAHIAIYVAMVFGLVALIVDWAGCTVEGYAGIALSSAAFGMAVRYATLHERQQRISAGQAHPDGAVSQLVVYVDEAYQPDADEAFAKKLTELARRSRKGIAAGQDGAQ